MIVKLLSVATLASVALAQCLSIVQPTPGTKVASKSAMTVELERPTPDTDITDVAFMIGVSACFGGPCSDNSLGHILYNGNGTSWSTNSAGKQYQNITVTTPDFLNGIVQLSVAHVYLQWVNSTLEQEFTKTTVNMTGATG